MELKSIWPKEHPWIWWISALAILLGVGLRFFLLDFHPLNYDELITVNVLGFSDWATAFRWISKDDTQLPLYYMILFFLKPLGLDSTAALRLPSLIFGVLALVQNFKLAKEIKGSTVAMISTAFLSLSFLAIYHTNEVRPYSLLLLLSIWSTRNLWKLIHHSEPSRPVLLRYLVSAILLMMTHYYGLMFFCVQALFWVLSVRLQLKKKAFVLLVPFLFFLPFIRDFFTAFMVTHTFRKPLGLQEYLGMFSYFFSGRRVVLFLMALFLWQFLVFFNRKNFKEDLKENRFLWFLFLGPILIAVLKNLILSPSLEPRYMIFCLVPAYILLAERTLGLNRRIKTLSLPVLVCILGLMAAHLLWKEKILTYPYRIDSRGAAERAKELAVKNESPIFSCNVCLTHYLKDSKLSCIADDHGESLPEVPKDSHVVLVDMPVLHPCGFWEVLSREMKLQEAYDFSGFRVGIFSR